MPTETMRVLVADDDHQMRDILTLFIEDFGLFNVILIAADGEKALTFGLANPIDLIITDLEMPRMNGDELIRRLLKQNPNLPAILISGDAQKLFDAALRLPRTTKTLHKPFSLQELRRAVKKLGFTETRVATR